MKRLLITGATGFIGRHCLELLKLEKAYEIHAVSSKEQKGDGSDMQWHKVDLLDSSKVVQLLAQVQPSHLLHFAWYTLPGKFWNSIENLRWVQASLELLQAFLLHGGQRVVFAGTCAEYNWKYGYCSENLTPLSPQNLYGACKHSLQIMVDAFCKHTGLSSAWGRIFLVYGPHDYLSKLVPSVTLSLLQGKPAKCSSGSQIRDYLYVTDVADAFIRILRSDVQGPINIASGYPILLKEIVYKIADKLNGRDLVRFGALPAPQDEPELLVGDVSRLRVEVGWSPKLELEYGLDNTIEWCRNLIRNNELED